MGKGEWSIYFKALHSTVASARHHFAEDMRPSLLIIAVNIITNHRENSVSLLISEKMRFLNLN